MRIIAKCILGACAILLASGSPGLAAAQSGDVTNAPADYRHKGTDTIFPARVGDFRRINVHEYNADGSDASAGYDLIRDGNKLATVTIYIYPMGGAGAEAERQRQCVDEYAKIKQAIGGAYRNVKIVSEDVARTPSWAQTDGLRAKYTFDAAFAGADMPVRSEAYLYCARSGRWFVQYRGTWPATLDLSSDMAGFIDTLRGSSSLLR